MPRSPPCTALASKVVQVQLPDLPYAALMNLLLAEAAASFEDLTLSGQDDTLTWQDADAWPNAMRKARFLSAVDHVQLDRLRYLVMQALDGLFQQCDVLIGPFSTGPMLIASNFTGHPCLHLRARRLAEGKTKREVVRCLKRYIARRVWRLLEDTPPPALAS